LIPVYKYFAQAIMTNSGDCSTAMLSSNYSTLEIKAMAVGIKRWLLKNINVSRPFIKSECSIVWDIGEDKVSRAWNINRTFHPSSTCPQTFEMSVVDY
tara:strand:+ start:21 stop:314 length:294 start_codon:yes stop_codon:yes gene_type:complete